MSGKELFAQDLAQEWLEAVDGGLWAQADVRHHASHTTQPRKSLAGVVNAEQIAAQGCRHIVEHGSLDGELEELGRKLGEHLLGHVVEDRFAIEVFGQAFGDDLRQVNAGGQDRPSDPSITERLQIGEVRGVGIGAA